MSSSCRLRVTVTVAFLLNQRGPAPSSSNIGVPAERSVSRGRCAISRIVGVRSARCRAWGAAAKPRAPTALPAAISQTRACTLGTATTQLATANAAAASAKRCNCRPIRDPPVPASTLLFTSPESDRSAWRRGSMSVTSKERLFSIARRWNQPCAPNRHGEEFRYVNPTFRADEQQQRQHPQRLQERWRAPHRDLDLGHRCRKLTADIARRPLPRCTRDNDGPGRLAQRRSTQRHCFSKSDCCFSASSAEVRNVTASAS